jgi:hypothetical protein
MDTASFKRNVLRTVGVKTAKFGLRNTARESVDTNALHGVFGLNTEVGGLLQNMRPYILGVQLNDGMLQDAFTSFGGVSYYLVLLAKTLKVKVPGSGTKRHLKGMTPTEALLRLNSLSGDLLYFGMSVFHGGLGDKEGAAQLVEQFIEVFWPLMYELLGVPPAQVFEDYIAKVAPGFPEGMFSTDAEVAALAVKQVKADEQTAIDSAIAASKQAREDKKAAKAALATPVEPGARAVENAA